MNISDEELQLIAYLRENLKKLKQVNKNDTDEYDGADAIANGLVEISGDVSDLRNRLIPKLVEAKNEGELEDLLHEVGETLRHVLYHVKDMKHFGYLSED